MEIYNKKSSAQKELESLPKDYTAEMAYKNNEILVTSERKAYNADRLRRFIYNFKHQIPDKVRITKFGIDGPATVSILESDGNNIKYTVDDSRLTNVNKVIVFNGTDIFERFVDNRFYSFNIVTQDYGLVPVFGYPSYL